jgi:hypothetical protein
VSLAARKRGRPPRDPAELVAEVAAASASDPSASASVLARRVRGRKQDVLRAVRLLNAAATRFPKAQGGPSGERPAVDESGVS